MFLEIKIARCWESLLTEKTQKSYQAAIKPLCKKHSTVHVDTKGVRANTPWLVAFPSEPGPGRSGLMISHLVSFCSKLGTCVYWPSVVKCSSPSSKAALCSKSLKAKLLCIKYLLEVLDNSFIHILFLPWSLFIGSGMRSTGPSGVQVREGNGTPLQYSCLENPMDGGAWWAAVHGVAKSQTRLSDLTFIFHFHFSLSCIGEGNGNPLQCSCLENPRDGGAWWAAVYGVAQSRTRLKWLSSSSSSSWVQVIDTWYTLDPHYPARASSGFKTYPNT